MKIQNHVQEIIWGSNQKSRVQCKIKGLAPGRNKERSQESHGRKEGQVGFKVVKFRQFIVYKIRSPKDSPIGSGHLGWNDHPGLKEQIRVKWNGSREV